MISHHFFRVLGGFGGPWRALWGVRLGMLEELWSFLGIVWVQNGARNVKMRVSKAILAQVEVARGSQRLSMGRFWEDVHHLLCAIWYFGMFSVRKGWCILCYKGVVHFGGCFSHSSLFAFYFVHAFVWRHGKSLGLVCCDWSGLLTCGLVCFVRFGFPGMVSYGLDRLR